MTTNMCMQVFSVSVYSPLYLTTNTMVRGQNLERRNVERPIFQNFKITNITTTIVLFLNYS